MKLYHLRKIRIIVSLLFFIALLFLFLGIGIKPLHALGEGLLRLQFFPSVLRFMALFFSVTALGFVLILVLTWLFGRVYCSSICPLGTFQDIVIAIARLFKSKKGRRFHYTSNRKRILRYGILAATIIFWIFGSMLFINLLDPFSNFGKLSTSLFQPAYIWLNNTLAFTLESMDVHVLTPQTMHTLPGDVLLVSGIIFLTITTMAAWRGRLFCNTLCPVGSILGLVSSRSLYRIRFRDEACTFCKRCERVCKAECLDSKTKEVDQSRCISCFNCFTACPNQGLYYANAYAASEKQNNTPKAENANKRRHFLLGFAGGILSLPILKKTIKAQGRSEPGMIPIDTQRPVSPPGSISHNHFTAHCIACYRCVGACPTKVIVPAFFDFGLEGFMQPKLDFHKNYCNYDCNDCTKVCPTGAITSQSIEDKKLIKMGEVHFQVESCIVTVDRTDCGACSEHCPTKAVQMVPYDDGLFIPEITPELCVGCGACEYACPTTPYKAIYVDGLPVHTKATPIEETNGPREDDSDDFPF